MICKEAIRFHKIFIEALASIFNINTAIIEPLIISDEISAVLTNPFSIVELVDYGGI